MGGLPRIFVKEVPKSRSTLKPSLSLPTSVSLTERFALQAASIAGTGEHPCGPSVTILDNRAGKRLAGYLTLDEMGAIPGAPDRKVRREIRSARAETARTLKLWLEAAPQSARRSGVSKLRG